MSQIIRPDSNVTQTSFTNGFAEIDESSASDADFAYGANNVAAVLEVGLSNPSGAPGAGTTTVRYRVAKTNAGTVDGGGNAVTVTAAVYQGTTLISEDSARTVDGTWTQYSWNPDMSSVTDWNDLRLRFTTSASGGSPANRRGGAVSWAELEAPDATLSLASSPAGTSTPTADITESDTLEATPAGSATPTMDVSEDATLAVSVTAVSSISADAIEDSTLETSLAGTGSVTADLSTDEGGTTSLEATIVATSTVTIATYRPKTIFGHYMGSFAAGTGAIQYHATLGLEELGVPAPIRADKTQLAAWCAGKVGGSYRNFALAPQSPGLTTAQAAELEVKRAIRIGFDGFNFDAWAGGLSARDLLDAMFTVCETQDLPFQLTIAMDASVMNGTDADLVGYAGDTFEKTLRWLMDHHGSSTKLAKRDGKVLIMGYQSIWPGIKGIYDYVQTENPGWTQEQVEAEVLVLRKTQQGWALIADRYDQMASNIGTAFYWQFDMYAFYEGCTGVTSQHWADAAAYLATRFPALGTFWFESTTAVVRDAALAGSAEWSPPTRLQYENYGWFQVASPGMDWPRNDWVEINRDGASLVQFITWNDYHESTNLSPGYNTRYAYYDWTGRYVNAWKNGLGVNPTSTTDRIYIFAHKYRQGCTFYPFTPAISDASNYIEIVVILPTAAKVRVQGRTTIGSETEWDAGVGMTFKKYPLTIGNVVVEWSRDNFVADINTLTLPDPIVERPFRTDVGKLAFSNQDQTHWDLDFPSVPTMFIYSEYADSDSDGLPNWFEMFWFGTWGMASSYNTTGPTDDPNLTGWQNLLHHTLQTDPWNAAPASVLQSTPVSASVIDALLTTSEPPVSVEGGSAVFGAAVFGSAVFGGSGAASVSNALAATVAGAASVSAELNSSESLASSINAAASVTADLSTSTAAGSVETSGGIFGSLAFGSGVFGGGAVEDTNSLEASVGGTSALSADLSVTMELSCTVSGTATVTADASISESVAVSVSSNATVTVDVVEGDSLSCSIASTTTVTAALSSDAPVAVVGYTFGSVVFGSSTFAGGYSVNFEEVVSLASTITSNGTVAADLVSAQTLATSQTATSALTTDVTYAATLECSISASTTVTADLSSDSTLSLAVSVVATSALTADLSEAATVAITISAQSALTANINAQNELAVSVTGTVTVSSDLSYIESLAVVVIGTSAVIVALSTDGITVLTYPLLEVSPDWVSSSFASATTNSFQSAVECLSVKGRVEIEV